MNQIYKSFFNWAVFLTFYIFLLCMPPRNMYRSNCHSGRLTGAGNAVVIKQYQDACAATFIPSFPPHGESGLRK